MGRPRGSRGRRTAMLAAALMASAGVHAQSAKDADGLELLAQENQVYSAARYVQTIAETPANVAVISREDIARYGYRSVHDALLSLPGVYDAASQWPALGVSGIAVPGDFGSRVLYMVNGMPIYEPTYGGFFLDYLDIESIERIEFVKGAGSALYGSGAVMGLVNLITRGGGDSAVRNAALGLASHGQAKAYWSHSHEGEGASSFVSASVERSAGRDPYLHELDNADFNAERFRGVSRDQDGDRTLRLFARLARDQAWMQALVVAGSKRDPLASYDTVFNAPLTLRESLGAFETGIQHDVGASGQLTARAYLFGTAERGDYPYTFSGERGAPPDYINVSDLSSRQLGAELRYDCFFAMGHHLLTGIEAKRIAYTHQVGDQPDMLRRGVLTVDTSASYTQWGAFAQDEMRTGPGKLFLGARFDSYHGLSDGVTSRVSPRVAYVQELASGDTAKLVYGEAYRAPTIYESRYQDGLPAAETIWANPDLRPELSRSMEALLVAAPARTVQWRLSGFVKRLRDTPEQVLTPQYRGIDCALGPDGCIQYRNSGRTQKVAGVEADLRLRQGERGDLYASLVLQHGWDEDGELTSSPRRIFKAGVSHALPWPGADAAIEAQYVGGVRGRIDEDGDPRDSVPSYVLVNAAFNLARLPGGWRAALRVDNLFGRSYATVASRELQPLERVPADGRRIGVQLERSY
jgi:outer membrane receptor protein involved in Fe transport